MVNYSQHLKLLLLLCPLALGLAQEEQQKQQLEPLHRNKRTLTTICVEIQPSGPLKEPYFMCKGADFSNNGGQAQAQAQGQAQQLSDQQQPIYNYPQGAGVQYSMPPQQVPFPSFPSFGAGFFPITPSYEEAAPQSSPQSNESHGQSAAATPFAPASTSQSYGLSAVSYPASGGPAAAARGTAAGSSPAATPTAYADAGAPKSPPAPQTASLPKSQPAHSQAGGNGNPYESLVGSRHRMAMDDDVMNTPNVGFQPHELNTQYRRPEPMVGVAPQMMLMPLGQAQLQQPTAMPHPYYDDPVMRTFYASLGPQEPLLGQAQAEPLTAQAAPASAPAYAPVPPSYAPAAPPPPPPPSPPAQPSNNAYSKPSSAAAPSQYLATQSSPADGNACNSCTRPCSMPAESPVSYSPPSNCPSFQPVIIAMPCYGQQQPTHYLAVPGTAGGASGRESQAGSPFGAFGSNYGGGPQVGSPFGMSSPQVGSPFGMSSPQVGSPFGMSSPHVGAGFGMGSQAAGVYGMASPQVGSSFGMGPQVGAPFGLNPVLNPFGPFGNLNPFNPFNRILGAAAPTTPQPRMRLFGTPDGGTIATSATTAGTTATTQGFKLSSSSSTAAPPTEPVDVSVGASRDDDDDDEDGDVVGSQEVTELPHASDTTEDDTDDVSKSAEGSKDLSADQLLKKSEDKLKSDKRKRHNSRYTKNNDQKKKYVQQLKF